jgi:hypothetical protein
MNFEFEVKVEHFRIQIDGHPYTTASSKVLANSFARKGIIMSCMGLACTHLVMFISSASS